ncbi:MAG: UDP-N-acetylmuramoyl-L-alanyl-D-glutamate--2,6-diaminopimelate ligase [Jiangellaceae bacterium]|nr:UDP-N-acetylmuramoyl-L-alanyl-D-glutamate--2,6-diaminopimelate ligase [Jiangellaceae bacterium]
MRDLPRPERVTQKPLEEIAAIVGRPADRCAGRSATGITHDSRRVRPGDLYAALPGAHTHGADFADAAARAGAVAILTDLVGADRTGGRLPTLVVDDPRRVLGAVAAHVYGQPARALTMLGVTGTNGKTTTAHLVECGLRASGTRAGLIGTVETSVGDEHFPSVRTTPEATDLHALLAVMRERSCTACVMEVSSHALALGRVDGILFDVAGFTNLSQDHLDFHADLEDYFAAKAKLFTAEHARRGVVVVDDDYGRRLAARATTSVQSVSTRGGDADWQVAEQAAADRPRSSLITVQRRDDQTSWHVRPPIPGEFNVANTVLALAMLASAGVSTADAARALDGCPGVPGRMEQVRPSALDQPLAVVDYAHTPVAVEQVLTALRPATPGRLIVVVGSGGDRDPLKRPAIGAAAARHADLVIVTDDNPRYEDPAGIRAAVLAGALAVPAGERGRVEEVADRRAAIVRAVEATSGDADTVVVVGKGHEPGQEFAGVVHPFDDRVMLRAALTEVRDRRTRTSS